MTNLPRIHSITFPDISNHFSLINFIFSHFIPIISIARSTFQSPSPDTRTVIASTSSLQTKKEKEKRKEGKSSSGGNFIPSAWLYTPLQSILTQLICGTNYTLGLCSNTVSLASSTSLAPYAPSSSAPCQATISIPCLNICFHFKATSQQRKRRRKKTRIVWKMEGNHFFFIRSL